MPSDLTQQFPPRRACMHEACGPGASVFAAVLGGALGGPVLWVSGRQVSGTPLPEGLAPYCDPTAILLARAGDHTKVLACTEEALRAGAVALVVAEISQALGLTAGRRLQLAAEAGNTIGLMLIGDGMGSNAAETRWQCSPVFDPADSTRMRWQPTKNKSGTFGDWTVRWDATTRRINVVSGPADGTGVAQPPG